MTYKILHIINGLSTGGAERSLCNILTAGLAQRFNNQVLSLTDMGTFGPQICSHGVPVLTLGMQEGQQKSVARLRQLRSIIRHFAPDIIQGWMYHGNFAATVARRLARGRSAIVWNVRHSLYDIKEEKPLTRWVIRANRIFSAHIHTIIYNSHLSRSQHEEYGFDGRRGCVISNGFDAVHFHPDQEVKKAVRTTLGIPQDALVVGHIGRFHPVKDHISFLQAAAHLQKKISKVHFLMVGREIKTTNPSLQSFISQISTDRIHMLGERTDVEKLIMTMDVLCQSSCSEAFPNVLGEAMACCIPCVATNVGDSERIIDTNGIIIPPQDPVALANGVEQILSLSKDKRRALGKAARHHIVQKYSLDAAVSEYCTLYNSILTDHP